jgi:toxin ParE1/3/4
VIRLAYSAAAERDLMEIAENIAIDNPDAALRFVGGIREHCLLLETLPFMGRRRSDIHPDLRSFPHRSYTIYYRGGADHDQIEILRIWHSRRKTPTISDLIAGH